MPASSTVSLLSYFSYLTYPLTLYSRHERETGRPSIRSFIYLTYKITCPVIWLWHRMMKWLSCCPSAFDSLKQPEFTLTCRLASFLLNLFLHLCQKRTFRDKWCRPHAIAVTQPTVSEHLIPSGNIAESADDNEIITSRAGMVAKYCKWVCLSVCVSGRISPEPHARSLPIFVRVAYVRGSVLVRHVDDRPHRLSAGSGWRECTAWAKRNLHCRVFACTFTKM